MKRKEKLAYEYHQKLMKDYYEASEGSKQRILKKVAKNSTDKHWLAGFETAIDIVFDERMSNSDMILNYINEEVK